MSQLLTIFRVGPRSEDVSHTRAGARGWCACVPGICGGKSDPLGEKSVSPVGAPPIRDTCGSFKVDLEILLEVRSCLDILPLLCEPRGHQGDGPMG